VEALATPVGPFLEIRLLAKAMKASLTLREVFALVSKNL